MSDVDLPVTHVRNQVAAAIDVVVHLARLRGGRRVVWEVAAIEGTHHGDPVVTPVFRYRSRAAGSEVFEATGAIPEVAASLAERGEPVDDALFTAGSDLR